MAEFIREEELQRIEAGLDKGHKPSIAQVWAMMNEIRRGRGVASPAPSAAPADTLEALRAAAFALCEEVDAFANMPESMLEARKALLDALSSPVQGGGQGRECWVLYRDDGVPNAVRSVAYVEEMKIDTSARPNGWKWVRMVEPIPGEEGEGPSPAAREASPRGEAPEGFYVLSLKHTKKRDGARTCGPPTPRATSFA